MRLQSRKSCSRKQNRSFFEAKSNQWSRFTGLAGLDVRWMAWNCKIIRFSRTDSAIKCYRGVETGFPASPPPRPLPPVAGPATRCRQAACIDAAMFADQTDFITRWTRAVCWRKILNDRKAPSRHCARQKAGWYIFHWMRGNDSSISHQIYVYTYLISLAFKR